MGRHHHPPSDDSGGGGGGGGAVAVGSSVSASASAEDVQKHLQLEQHDGKFLTRQEILLLQLYDILKKQHPAALLGNGIVTDTSLTKVSPRSSPSGSLRIKVGSGSATKATTPTSATLGGNSSAFSSAARTTLSGAGPGGSGAGAGAVTLGGGAGSGGASAGGATGHGLGTPSGIASATTPGGSTGTGPSKPQLSAVERAKALMARKSATLTKSMSMPPGVTRSSSSSSHSTAVKRSNPLTAILKGGSGSVVGGVHASSGSTPTPKRPRTKSDKPGEIRLGNGRGSIQLPLESFLRSEDWDSTVSTTPLEIVLPEVAFATNNTLIIHATMPVKSIRCCFNISTQSSLISGAPYPGTALYHFNPRRQGPPGTVGGHGRIIQNSNIDGRWGCIQPLPRCPISFGEPFTLRLTIVPSGFLVFLEEVLQDEFKHRVPIREGENLVLTVPCNDENGHAEMVTVHSVWWGHAEAPANLEQFPRQGPGGFGGPDMGMGGSGPRNHRGGGGPGGGFGGGPYNHHYHRRGSMPDGNLGPGGGGGGGGGGFGGPGGRGGFGHPPHPFEVFVGSLPRGTSREELSNFFDSFAYESVRITARGVGFVTLRNEVEMRRAIEELDGKEFRRGVKIQVSSAIPRR